MRGFVRCVDDQCVPPLGAFLPDFVREGYTVAPDDFRLLPLTPALVQLANVSSHCLTDCAFHLQSKYRQTIPDAWGGHLERGSRDVAIIGFNILEGVVLDILEINQPDSYLAWAEPILDALNWQQLLVRAVVEFGQSCQAQQIRLQPPYAGQVQPSGFAFDPALGCAVLNLAGQ